MEPKKRQIMSAAEKLISHGRFHEITMDEVAKTAGVGKGTIYRYFKDKDALFAELAFSGYEELAEVVGAQRKDSSDFKTCLVKVCRHIARFYRERNQLMHMMQSEERRALWKRGRFREEFMDRRRLLQSAVESVLKEGLQEGVIRSDVSQEVLTHFLLSVLRMAAWSRRREEKTEVNYDTVVDLFMHGAAAKGTEQ